MEKYIPDVITKLGNMSNLLLHQIRLRAIIYLVITSILIGITITIWKHFNSSIEKIEDKDDRNIGKFLVHFLHICTLIILVVIWCSSMINIITPELSLFDKLTNQ